MTGYRAFSKKFVKTVPIMSTGFQVETELTISALYYRYNIESIPIQYRDRPEGSHSKLNTISDGFKVLLTLFDMAKNCKPLTFFSIVGLITFILSLFFGIPVIREYYLTQHISKLSSTLMFSSLMIITLSLVSLGLILDHQSNANKINHELLVNEWIDNNK